MNLLHIVFVENNIDLVLILQVCI